MRHVTRASITAIVFAAGLAALAGCSQGQTAQSGNNFKTASNTTSITTTTDKQFNYQYFPDQQVYFDVSRNMYFWQSTNGWTNGHSLPGTVRLQNAPSVNVPLFTDTPWRVHTSVISAFPPGSVQTAQANTFND